MMDIPYHSDIFTAYAAGLFDGEGCVRIGISEAGTGAFFVTIANTYLPVLNELKIRWDGSIRKQKGNGVRKKNFYQLSLCGDNGETFLHDILPYCIIKKEQVKVALEFREFQRLKRKQNIKDVDIYEEKDYIEIQKYSTRLRELKQIEY